MKKECLFLIYLFIFITSAYSQNKGQLFFSGTFQLSTSTDKDKIDNISSVSGKKTDFSIIPSVHYFLNEHWAVGAGIGYKHVKTLTGKDTDDNELYNKTNTFVLKPSAYYYAKLGDKFYYTPQAYISLETGTASSDISKKKSYDMDHTSYSIGVSILSFEFRPTRNIGLNISCGDLYYEHTSLKKVPMGAKTIDKSTNKFNFKLQDAFSFSFKYYL